MLSAMCSSDLIAILRGGPYSIVPQLRDNPSCKSSFLECIWGKGVTFWVPTHAPHSLVTCPGSVSTFLSHHARGSPLGVALSCVVSVPGSPSGGMGTSRVRLPPTGTRTMALKPPFFFPYYCSEALRPLAVSPPSTVFPTHRYRGWHRRCLNFGDAYTRRRLILATPHLGDASPWRHLILATPHLGDASPWRRLTFATPHFRDASPWQRLTLATPHLGDAFSGQPVDFLPLGPLEGFYNMLTLTLTSVNARGQDGTQAPQS